MTPTSWSGDKLGGRPTTFIGHRGEDIQAINWPTRMLVNAEKYSGPPEYRAGQCGWICGQLQIRTDHQRNTEIEHGVAVMATGGQRRFEPDEYLRRRPAHHDQPGAGPQDLWPDDPELRANSGVHSVRRFPGAGTALLLAGLLYPFHRQRPGVENPQPRHDVSMFSTGASAPMVNGNMLYK
jgi:hypothetical protein